MILAPGPVGFTSMDGAIEDDLYAVGFEGEVWRCSRGTWKQMKRVTDVVLQCVRVVAPDRIYACGENGMLLRGSAKGWKVPPAKAVEEEELWSLEVYNGEVYVASNTSIYELDEKEVPRRIDTKCGEKLTHAYLHAADGLLRSFGVKDILMTEDGKTWKGATPGSKKYRL